MSDEKKIKTKNSLSKKIEKKVEKSKNESKTNKYTIIRKIGEGSFGKVYVVSCNDIQYVMKQINLYGLSKKEIEKTYQEVKILQKFNHPNIIKFKQVFESGINNKNLNIITEYAEKGDLYKLMISRKGKKFEEKIIIDWLTQICQALKYIHNKLIIHRDIKPHNIFLTKKGFIKLGDFGVSKTLNYTLQKVKTCIGTIYYLPPEIIKEEDYSFMADIWSLGVTFYQLMTFKLPFDGNNILSITEKIISGKEYEKITNYSNNLINVVYKMMSIDPKNRPKPSDILNMDFIKKRMIEYLDENKYNNLISMNVIKHYQKNINKDEKEILNDKEDDKNNSNKIKINNKNEKNENKEIKHINIKIHLKDQKLDNKRNKSSNKISLAQILLKAKNYDKNVYDIPQKNIPNKDDIDINKINESKIKIKKINKNDGNVKKEIKEVQQKEEEMNENDGQKKIIYLMKVFSSNEKTRDSTQKKFQFESKFFKENIVFYCEREEEFDLRNSNDKNKLLETKKNNEIKKEMREEYDLQRQMNLFSSYINGQKSDDELEKENKLYKENQNINSGIDSDSH